MWHASIAILGKHRPVPVRAWNSKQIRKARGRLTDLLAGVSTGEDFWKAGDDAYHLRRPLSEPEISLLSAAWLAIPAVDLSG